MTLEKISFSGTRLCACYLAIGIAYWQITHSSYILHDVSQGEVFANSGAWGNTVSKADSSKYFWAVIAIYALMSFALITIF